MAIRGTYYYDWFEPKYYFFTWVRALVGITIAVQSVDLALSAKGRLKVGEKDLPALYEDSQGPRQHMQHPSRLPQWMLEALDVAFSLRGLGWEFGKGVNIPKDTRPQERSAFLKATAFTFLKTFPVVDLGIAIIQQLPGIGSTAGGSMFYTSLPSIPRYVASTAIFLLSGATMTAGFEALYSIGTLVGVGLLRQAPGAWPPLTANPFTAESLGDFWARRWHQMLRRTFMVAGGIPLGMLLGRAGAVFGAFFASGLFHEFGTYATGRGMDHRVTIFFVLQGVGVVLEGVWKQLTGRRVCGWPGRVWAYLVMVPLGQMCLDAWFIRGLGGALFIPKFMSPAQSIVVPAVKQLLGRL
ncbi:membrane bound O-acyl transferase family-domain-containing protein [Phanerochaete sordida]|uniref:Membrane bound O-acyl transferase family-domain-containing protein n=1 Tax=Phanerochaete sordida TaxID=48140 RepID=A0A9P3LFX5_9APHY|nr:membrane bound O-acyl transferase family-domain-containing protein [Phanerochaete sordida]